MIELFLGLGLAWLVYALLFFGVGFAIGRATAKPKTTLRGRRSLHGARR